MGATAVVHARRGLALLLLAIASMASAAEPQRVRLSDDTELAIEQYPARSRTLLIYLPTGLGRAEGEARLAAALARRGLNVWRPELLEARFLPALESSLADVPDSDLVDLLRAAQATGKRVYLLAVARGGLLAVRTVTAAVAAGVPPPAGLILLHPNLYTGQPTPGRAAEYDAAVAQLNVPVMVLQPERSPWRWRVPALEATLRQGGAPVYLQFVADVRDRYFFRPDATDSEEAATAKLPDHVRRAVRLLARTPPGQPQAAPAIKTAAPADAAGPKRGLQPYRGKPQPPALILPDVDGKRHALADYRGRVVLINFWASWCPPCVHEMPSMQRLKEKLAGRPFTILAVNMGEDERTIGDFLKQVQVDFTVLQDRDGAALKRWQVFVFPTSYIIGRDGRIKYALFGEYQWDQADALAVFERLLTQP